VPESSLPAELAELPQRELVARLVAVVEDNTRLREGNARLREVIEAQAVQLETARGQLQALTRRVEELERKAGKDSSNSGKPPSSDPVWDKKAAKEKKADRSLRVRGRRSPGKQPGAGSSTLKLVDDPDEMVWCRPGSCGGCGGDLSGEPVAAERRHQVTDIEPAAAPIVTEYRAQAKCCPGCGTTSVGELPLHVRARASYGPETHAQAANLIAHHIPVYRSTILLAQLGGISVSSGWMASVRGKAAALVASSGFMDHVAALLKTAAAVHVDETPARAGGGTRYVHLACTRYLTHLHTGDRSADAIDSGGVLPGYSGIIVRDGYKGYEHLADALHAWCAVHILRDLKALYDFEPAQQAWAQDMAGLLIEARDAAATARQDGATTLPEGVLADLLARYSDLADAGLAGNLYRRSATADDARRLARRFGKYQDLILRFVTRPDLDIFSNNEAERTIRPTKVQMRSSGGCWRTLQGLTEFALIQSYLSTAGKWGIDKLDALRRLFTGNAWLPPGLQPA
jgi:transposase